MASLIARARHPERFAPLIWSLRPLQWIKNLVCVAGLVFSGRLLMPDAVVATWWTFVAFCLVSSALYLVNDVHDVEEDRLHKRTRDRPIAAGRLPKRAAVRAAAVLAILAALVVAYVGLPVAMALAGYAVLGVAYTYVLRYLVVLDVFAIAVGFVVRVVAGVLAVGAVPTSWILLSMFFFALYLGFAKRRSQVAEESDALGRRSVLASYSTSYLSLAIAVTAALALMSYSLFAAVVHANQPFVVTVPVVAYALLRYGLLVSDTRADSDPDQILVTDPHLIASGLIWAALTAVTLYAVRPIP